MKRKRAPIDDHADPHSPEPSGRTPLAVVRLLVLAATGDEGKQQRNDEREKKDSLAAHDR